MEEGQLVFDSIDYSDGGAVSLQQPDSSDSMHHDQQKYYLQKSEQQQQSQEHQQHPMASMFETFHQSLSTSSRTSFHNPFVVRRRRKTSAAQHRKLEEYYATNPRPSAAERQDLADELHMNLRSLQIWFQNRRAKDRHDVSSHGHSDRHAGDADQVELVDNNQFSHVLSGRGISSLRVVPLDRRHSMPQFSASMLSNFSMNCKNREYSDSAECVDLDSRFRALREAIFGSSESTHPMMMVDSERENHMQSANAAYATNPEAMSFPKMASTIPFDPLYYMQLQQQQQQNRSFQLYEQNVSMACSNSLSSQLMSTLLQQSVMDGGSFEENDQTDASSYSMGKCADENAAEALDSSASRVGLLPPINPQELDLFINAPFSTFAQSPMNSRRQSPNRS